MNKLEIELKGLFVGEGVTIEGKVETSGRIEVYGLISGDVTAGDLLIQPGGKIEGTISTSSLDVSGIAGSSVNVVEQLLVRSTGRIDGDVTYGSIQIESGAAIFGTINQQSKPKNGVMAASVPEPQKTTDLDEEGHL
jgi:cytoskeletal protein CcmA (bactofilin family)